MAREQFEQKGGITYRKRPHYMTLEACPWLLSWYKQGKSISIDVEGLNRKSISFTYGDMFPVFGPYEDMNAEYKRQVYTYLEIMGLIMKYGLPQEWNPRGEKGPVRYIEAQIWDDQMIDYIKAQGN